MTELRAVTDGDLSEVLSLLQASLGWVPDAQFEAFFRWKHHDNPFGRSPGWVAVEDGRILSFRTFLRWEWQRDGTIVRAVRAVDTATHPDAQGRGLFRTLTLHAVDAMRDDGVAFVFNTPNTQSRPGYLKMGWIDVGRPPVRVRPRSPFAAIRVASARVPADKWSLPTTAGEAIADALADDAALDALLRRLPSAPRGALRTNRSVAQLRWRFGFGPLAYRAERIGTSIDDGLVVFRLRRRGPATEAAVLDVLAPAGSTSAVRRAVRRILRTSGADYAITLGPDRALAEGLLPLPGQGPILTWRAVNEETVTPLEAWRVGLGDIELF
jgi:GNAT superfamily N-acetyltransferase